MSTFMGGVSKILKYIFNYHCNLDEIWNLKGSTYMKQLFFLQVFASESLVLRSRQDGLEHLHSYHPCISWQLPVTAIPVYQPPSFCLCACAHGTRKPMKVLTKMSKGISGSLCLVDCYKVLQGWFIPSLIPFLIFESYVKTLNVFLHALAHVYTRIFTYANLVENKNVNIKLFDFKTYNATLNF